MQQGMMFLFIGITMALVQGIWCPSAMPVIVHGVRSVFLKAYIQAGRFLRFIFAVRLFRLV